MRAAPALLALPLLLAGLAAGAVPPTAGVLPPVAGALLPSQGPFTQVACPFLAQPDPLRPLEICNVRATTTNGPANEIDLAMDPADPDHLVVVGKGYAYHRIVGDALLGAVITPYATTFDGGRTWHEGYLQPVTQHLATLPVLGDVGRTANFESDPIVEFLPDGGVLAVTLRTNLGGGLPVYRSDDGGVTFRFISMAYTGGTDKEWMVSDPVTGNVYLLTLHQGGMGFLKSSDGGFTWSAPQRICGCVFPAVDVGPKGELYVAGYTGNSIVFLRSLDAGATWSAPQFVASHTGFDWNLGNLRLWRTTNIQMLAASKADASVYLVWGAEPPGTPQVPFCAPLPPSLFTCAQLPNWDIWLAHSRDGGRTWSAPQRVNDDATSLAAQFNPQVAVSPRGDVHVAWHDQRNDPSGLTYEMYYAHSADGVAFDANLKLTDAPSVGALGHHQSVRNLAFVGDYIGLQASDDRAVVAYPDTRYGRMDIFVATIV